MSRLRQVPSHEPRHGSIPATLARFRSAAIMVGLGIVGVLFLEAGSFMFGRFPIAADPLLSPERAAEREFDSELFWRLKAGAHQGIITINSAGLRGPEIPSEKGREFRLLSLGESTTFARALPYEESYSALLEQHLRVVRGRALRVINGGVPAYTLFQGFQYFRLRAGVLQPDALLVYFGYNDFLPVTYLSALRDQGTGGGATDRELFAVRQSARGRLSALLLEHSNLLRGVGAAVRSLRPESAPLTNTRRPRVPEEDRRWLLDQLDTLCRQRRVDLILVVPWYREFEDHAPVLREFASAHGVALVDLPRRLRNLPRPRASYFLDSVHPTAEGHRLIAQAIEEDLRALWH